MWSYARRMHSTLLWRTMWSGLGLGLASVLGSSLLPAALASMAVGYGVLVVLAALYLAVGLVIRERAWRRLAMFGGDRLPSAGNFQGRRVF